LIGLYDIVQSKQLSSESEQQNIERLVEEWDPLVAGLGSTSNNDSGVGTCLPDILSKAIPYVIPIDAIQIRFSFPDTTMLDMTSEAAILAALNGSIVGLCCSSKISVSEQQYTETDIGAAIATGEEEEGNSNDDSLSLSCVGLGIVRSIDTKQRLLYIITPCSEYQLQSVTVLMIASTGDIQIPTDHCIFQGTLGSSFPYQTFAIDKATGTTGNGDYDDSTNNPRSVLGAWPMRSRNSIARRSFQT
jgi:hypothetical protein